MDLPILDLTSQAFAPFGKVIEQPARDTDASGPGWNWWGGAGLLPQADRPYAIGYLDLQPAPLKFDWSERHMRTAELLVPTGGDCLVYVGPSEHMDDPERLPKMESFRVFRVRQGQAVLLDPGVWHGAPLALGRALNVVVLLQKDTSVDDGYVVRFPETPVRIIRKE